MSRAIDADALEKEGWSLHRTIRVDKNTDEYQTKPLRKVPTIEPRCETCEAFNKTRLLIPQPQRKKGKWIDTTQGDHYKCSCCGTRAAFWFNEENSSGWEKDMSEWLSDYCPNCGAEMEDEG